MKKYTIDSSKIMKKLSVMDDVSVVKIGNVLKDHPKYQPNSYDLMFKSCLRYFDRHEILSPKQAMLLRRHIAINGDILDDDQV